MGKIAVVTFKKSDKVFEYLSDSISRGKRDLIYMHLNGHVRAAKREDIQRLNETHWLKPIEVIK